MVWFSLGLVSGFVGILDPVFDRLASHKPLSRVKSYQPRLVENMRDPIFADRKMGPEFDLHLESLQR